MQLTLAAGRPDHVRVARVQGLTPSLFFCCGGADLLSLAGVRVRPSSARRLPFVKMEDSLAGLPIARCGSDVRGSWLRSSAQEISEIDPSIIEQ